MFVYLCDYHFPSGASIGFNGIDTIQKKVKYALDKGAGGVMIWEVGQDCRLAEVIRGGKTHVVTCPEGPKSSLLVAMQQVIAGAERGLSETKGRTTTVNNSPEKEEL